MTLLGGPVAGWLVEPTGETRERSVRDAIVQAVRLLVAGDYDALWRLLDHRSRGAPVGLAIAQGWLDLYVSLGDERQDATAMRLKDAEAEGFVFLLPAVDAAVVAAEREHGRLVEESESLKGELVYTFADGAVLAFERHPVAGILWRDVSAKVAEEIRAEEAAIDAEAGREPGEELLEPHPKALALLPPVPLAEAEELERATAAAEETLAQAKVEARTVWAELAASTPTSPPPTCWCCSCAQAFGEDEVALHHGDVYAHRACVEAELEAQGAGPHGALDRPVCLELARGAVGSAKGGAFKARKGKAGNRACELCLKPIRPGELQWKKSETSSKRLHDACRSQVLSKAKEAGDG